MAFRRQGNRPRWVSYQGVAVLYPPTSRSLCSLSLRSLQDRHQRGPWSTLTRRLLFLQRRSNRCPLFRPTGRPVLSVQATTSFPMLQSPGQHTTPTGHIR